MSTAAIPQSNEVTSREVMLIDLSSLFWRAWHATKDQEVSEAASITLSMVRRCNPDGARLVAVCCDSGRSFRKDLLPTYKAQRPEKDALAIGEIERVKDRLRADGYLLWEATGFEADDVIATAAVTAWGIGHNVLIASADKDLLQLVGGGVRVLRTHGAQWDEWGEAKVLEKFGVRPAQFGDWLALVGDPGDGIKGAPGVGPKRATDLLKTSESLSWIWAYLQEKPLTVGTPGIVKLLTENKDQIILARKLIELRKDVPIRFEDIYQERKPVTTADEDGNDVRDADFSDDAISPPHNGAPPPAVDAGKQHAAQAEKQATLPLRDAQANPTAPPPAAESPTSTPPVAPAKKPEPTHVQTTALAPIDHFDEVSLQPNAMTGAWWLANRLYESRMYQRFQTKESMLAVILRGREIGLGALTSLDCWHVIQGRPSPHAWLIVARAKADKDCEYFQCVETTATSATWETKHRRNPKETRLTYTIQQAQAAGLTSNDNWKRRPEEMIRKTAAVQLARLEYPASALGLYAVDELGGVDE